MAKNTKIDMKNNESVLIPTDVETHYKDTSSALRRINDNGEVNISNLTPSEVERYSKLTASINVNDLNSITSYGQELQGAMSRYSNDFMRSVRVSKGGEIGNLINDLLTELGYVDVDDFEELSPVKKMMLKVPGLRNIVKTADKIINKYDTIDGNVEKITNKITGMRMMAIRDNNALQEMFNNNMEYGTQIEELIIAGKIKVSEIDKRIEEMTAEPDKYASYEIQDMQVFKHNLEKRINDMLTLRYVILQSLPQIRMVQYNNLSIADKAQSIISSTIPAWRHQISMALALQHQRTLIDATRKVSDTTNSILLKNAQLLKENSIYAAKENERGVVDIETLKTTHAKLVETIKEVQNIQIEAERNRKNAEAELTKLEGELQNTITQLAAAPSRRGMGYLTEG